MADEEKGAEPTHEKPKGEPGKIEKRSVLTGSKIFKLVENADRKYSTIEQNLGSQPASPEEQAEQAPAPKPTTEQQTSQKSQGTPQAEPQQQE